MCMVKKHTKPAFNSDFWARITSPSGDHVKCMVKRKEHAQVKNTQNQMICTRSKKWGEEKHQTWIWQNQSEGIKALCKCCTQRGILQAAKEEVRKSYACVSERLSICGSCCKSYILSNCLNKARAVLVWAGSFPLENASFCRVRRNWHFLTGQAHGNPRKRITLTGWCPPPLKEPHPLEGSAELLQNRSYAAFACTCRAVLFSWQSQEKCCLWMHIQ